MMCVHAIDEEPGPQADPNVPIGFRLLKGTLHHEFHSCDRAFQYAKLNN